MMYALRGARRAGLLKRDRIGRMSPVSRGRKKKRAATSRRSAPAGPGFEGTYAEMLRGFRPLLTETDPLEVEIFTSGLIGTWWQRLPPDVDPDELALGAVRYAASRRTPEALALVWALGGVGTSDRLRAAAVDAARDLMAAGVPVPSWAHDVGQGRATGCWWLRDVFGDQAQVLCAFDGPAGRHGLLVLVDFNHLGGWAKDVFLTDDPDDVLRMVGEQAVAEPLMCDVEPLEPGAAYQLLTDAFAATDATWEPDVTEDFRVFRALALARCRRLPEPTGAATTAPDVSEEERDAIVAEFLASSHAAGLPGAAARYCARLVVDFGADYDAGQPLRASPAKAETFLLGWLPRKVMLDERDRSAMPAVVAAWMRWAGERAGLDAAALAELDEVTAACGADFAEVYDDPAYASPARLLLRGLDTLGGAADLQEVLDRRLFAMPYVGTRIGEEDFPRLDPGDPDERRLLVIGEHPEYHDALDDAGFHGVVDGIDPNLHVALHEIVAAQLWDDDPPEAWQAAQRLLGAGMERHDVLHALANVLARHLHRGLANGDVDLDGYRTDLAALARHPGRQTRRAPLRSVGGVPEDAVYVIKVALRGARPPIWRRLRVPAAIRLPDLHHVIQAAFGWADDHLHLFEASGGLYTARPGEMGPGWHDERRIRLVDLAAPGERIRYEYDFGDSWEHDIVVESVEEPDGVRHAVCLAGRRAGPPEDCGGVPGYAWLCDVLADPAHPDHQERLEWLGYHHDPTAFDRERVNQSLAALRFRT